MEITINHLGFQLMQRIFLVLDPRYINPMKPSNWKLKSFNSSNSSQPIYYF